MGRNPETKHLHSLQQAVKMCIGHLQPSVDEADGFEQAIPIAEPAVVRPDCGSAGRMQFVIEKIILLHVNNACENR